MVQAALTDDRDVHLLVIIHGLWGSSQHVSQIEESIQNHFDKNQDNYDHQLRVCLLACLSNRFLAISMIQCPDYEINPRHLIQTLRTTTNESDYTYDGIDMCSIRAMEEIDNYIEDLLPLRVTRFSIVGYSLGGLIARFALGALHARTPSFFENIEPVNFTTFASPAIGIPKFPSIFSRILNYFGARLLSRTGEQLYASDTYVSGKPLLEMMAQPDTSFYKALEAFQKKDVFANCVNDRTVPFATGYFPEDYKDMFAKADKIGRSISDDAESVDAQVEKGGLSFDFQEDCPHIIKAIHSAKIAHPPQRAGYWPRLPSLPFFLRPKTFAGVPYKLGYLLPFFMPILIPSFLIYLMWRFTLQSMKSRKRIKAMLVGDLSTLDGQLRRVGLALEDTFEEIAEDVFPVNGGEREGPGRMEDTDAILTASQKRMTDNLNALPGLQKHLVYLPQERNSHGAIICRDPRWDGHKKGMDILRWWSERFIV